MENNKRIITQNSRCTLSRSWILPLAVLFLLFGCANQDFTGDIKSMMDRLDQIEKRLAKQDELQNEMKEIKAKIEEYKASFEDQLTKLTQKVNEKSAKIESAKAAAQQTPAAQNKSIAKAENRYHTVIRGETLFSISRKYGIPVAELRRLNNLKENQNIQTNQKLLISK
jgi:LysM repeat protein